MMKDYTITTGYASIECYKDTFIHVFYPYLDDDVEQINDNTVIAEVPTEVCREWYAVAGGTNDYGRPVKTFDEWHTEWSYTEDYDALIWWLKEHNYRPVWVGGDPDILSDKMTVYVIAPKEVTD